MLCEPARPASAISPPSFVARAWREQARRSTASRASTSRSVLAYDANGARVVARDGDHFRACRACSVLHPCSVAASRPPTREVGAPAVVMLSYEAWQRDYGGANDVLGRALDARRDAARRRRRDAGAVGRVRARPAPGRLVPAAFAAASTPPTGFQAAETIAPIAAGRRSSTPHAASSMRFRARAGGRSAAVVRRRAA